jgi:hypothetical protein
MILNKILNIGVILLVMTNSTKAQEIQPLNLIIDHVLIAVDNLESAKKEYESFGFTVIYGGGEKEALNALIFLKDGTLIELVGKDKFPRIYKFLNSIRITSLFGNMKDRITLFPKVRQGFFNYSLYSNNLNRTYQYLRANNIDADKPKKFGRFINDGVYTKWQLIGTKPYDIPFIIGDYIPIRISDSTFLEHKNKAIALDTISIATVSFDNYIKLYNILYQQQPRIVVSSKVKAAHYKVGNIILTLTEAEKINPYFKRNLSVTTSFTVKCDQMQDKESIILNEYIKLVN